MNGRSQRRDTRAPTTTIDELGVLEVATWNIGGGPEEKCQDFLPGLVNSHERLRRVHFLLIQEATQKSTLAIPVSLREWNLALFKSEHEWRGQGGDTETTPRRTRSSLRNCWGRGPSYGAGYSPSPAQSNDRGNRGNALCMGEDASHATKALDCRL